MSAYLENSAAATGLEKFSFQFQRRAMKECSNYYTVTFISHASKVMHKFV